jgi:hypothetical protein
VAAPRGVREEHPDLAVLDAPRRPAVLPVHARRLVTLLEEPGLVDDQHARAVAEALDHIGAEVIPHGVRVPRG